jgi:hypothetical protein
MKPRNREKSSFVEKMENLPGESNKVRTNANVCKFNRKSAKNIAKKSGKHKQSKNSPNWILKGSVVFVRSQVDDPPPRKISGGSRLRHPAAMADSSHRHRVDRTSAAIQP